MLQWLSFDKTLVYETKDKTFTILWMYFIKEISCLFESKWPKKIKNKKIKSKYILSFSACKSPKSF